MFDLEILAPVFGLFTSFILLYYLSSLNRSNVFLALFFLCCNLVVLVYFGLHYSKVEFWEGFCFVHFLPLSFLLGPLLFFYVKYSVSERKEFRRIDTLHLLPAALVILACWPFTSLSFDVKTKMAHEIVNITEDYRLNFYWITFEQLLYGRSIHLIIYSILSIIYFVWNKKLVIKKYGMIPTNHYVIKRWFFTLAFLQILIASMSLGHMITLYTQPFAFLGISSIDLFSEEYFFRICGGGFFVQNFLLFLFPKILYGNISYSEVSEDVSTFQKLKSSISKPLKSVHGEMDFNSIILPYLAESPFVRKNFTLSQMSFDLKISERLLSIYFNNELKKTFGEWKNDKRIEYASQLIHEGTAKKLTIEAISTLSGFVSRSKFIDAFKARKGVTPSVYIKENNFN